MTPVQLDHQDDKRLNAAIARCCSAWDSRSQSLRLRLWQMGSDTLKGDLDVSSGACPQVSN
jgi:hypothetical protein